VEPENSQNAIIAASQYARSMPILLKKSAIIYAMHAILHTKMATQMFCQSKFYIEELI